MDILAAIDSFKGSASSFELNQAVLNGWEDRKGRKINVPIADGGENTAEAIYYALRGTWRTIDGMDLLFRQRKISYLLTTWQGKNTAVIESAQALGLDLLDKPTDQTIRLASSYALGELIKDALLQEVEQIIVTLGGSGCSDGGLGLLQSLGASLEGYTEGNPLLSTKKLHFDRRNVLVSKVKLIIAADVTNPYTGQQGAAWQFGRQKGGIDTTLAFLDKQAGKIAQQIKDFWEVDLDDIPGSGAAGGIGGAIFLLGAKMVSGFDLVSQITGLEKKIEQADVIITGEGRIDQQTIHGKVPYGVAVLAKKYRKPIIAICGSRDQELEGLSDFLPIVLSIHLGPIGLEEAMEHRQTLEKTKILGQTLSRFFTILPK
ncbi:TPA: glycerate kinase [Enterococcus faecium]